MVPCTCGGSDAVEGMVAGPRCFSDDSEQPVGPAASHNANTTEISLWGMALYESRNIVNA